MTYNTLLMGDADWDHLKDGDMLSFSQNPISDIYVVFPSIGKYRYFSSKYLNNIVLDFKYTFTYHTIHKKVYKVYRQSEYKQNQTGDLEDDL